MGSLLSMWSSPITWVLKSRESFSQPWSREMSQGAEVREATLLAVKMEDNSNEPRTVVVSGSWKG